MQVPIANPLYDVVFRYMLEDKNAAKIFLSAIIGEEIEELDFAATERTANVAKPRKEEDERNTFDDYTITVCRFDFVAKIKTATGHKTATIELQKAKYSDDIMRFRKYLAKHYEDESNIYDKKGSKVRQIYSIYLLNYDIGLLDCPVIAVDHVAKNVSTGETITTDNQFIKSLHHKSWIIQLKQLPKKHCTKLEKFLHAFEVGAKNDKKHIITIDDEEIPEEYRFVIRRLVHAQCDNKLRGAMELEDEIIKEWQKYERSGAEKDATIAALQKDKAAIQKDRDTLQKASEEKDATIAAIQKALEEQKREIAELQKHFPRPDK